MNDKRFLKIRKVGEERYFRDNGELIKFIEKQTGETWDDMIDLYGRLLKHGEKIARRFWESQMNIDRDFLKIGDFICSIYRGCFDRTSGYYEINLLAQQRSNFSANDIDKLFNL